MRQPYAEMVRTRRRILGFSQRELAQCSGLKQPLIAAIESGSRRPSPAARQALDQALQVRPSQALAALRDEVQEVFTQWGLPRPRVFGSVASGEDTPSSDLDLLVKFDAQHDIVDLLALEEELSLLLTVSVGIVDGRSAGRVVDHARAEARPL